MVLAAIATGIVAFVLGVLGLLIASAGMNRDS